MRSGTKGHTSPTGGKVFARCGGLSGARRAEEAEAVESPGVCARSSTPGPEGISGARAQPSASQPDAPKTRSDRFQSPEPVAHKQENCKTPYLRHEAQPFDSIASDIGGPSSSTSLNGCICDNRHRGYMRGDMRRQSRRSTSGRMSTALRERPSASWLYVTPFAHLRHKGRTPSLALH